MEFFTTYATRLVRPMNAENENVFPVASRASMDPITASGRAEKMIKGWM